MIRQVVLNFLYVNFATSDCFSIINTHLKIKFDRSHAVGSLQVKYKAVQGIIPLVQ